MQVPQQPADFRPPVNGQSQGPWLTDWSGPPPNANYLAFGYTAAQNNQIVLYGWLYDVRQANPGSAQLIGKVYLGSLDEAGARKVAQQFAADILKQFGATSLIGTRIYFVSDRTGHKEIWSMNYDGYRSKAVHQLPFHYHFPRRFSGRNQDRLHHLPGAAFFAQRQRVAIRRTAGESRAAPDLHPFAGNRAQAGLL